MLEHGHAEQEILLEPGAVEKTPLTSSKFKPSRDASRQIILVFYFESLLYNKFDYALSL
jgi:hypothetical protein